MKPVLGQLLEGVIDYAGLYPPAELELESALNEYLALGEDRDWMVDLFVCSSNKLADLDQLLRQKGETVPVAVVGGLIDHVDKIQATIERDLTRMESSQNGEPTAYEVRIQFDNEAGVRRAIKSIDRSGVLDVVEDVYLEFPWSGHWEDALHRIAETNPSIGVKARTGGVTPDLFPKIEDLARFIYTAVSIEIPFKMTAGLHEPLRYHDQDLGVMRHGFLNVIFAGSLALAGDLSMMEIQEILGVTDPADIEIGEQIATISGHSIRGDQIDVFHSWFGGFGSCSVDEPVEGLKRLGYW